ncbi:replication initiation protein [Acinetobacter rongchengensis]|jgi:plasmid replication initiation protein|uniref:RepB family plasmid replication initiator protein n=1 Tax=Acinetobacter rongchengensis TaxID=2419601 RepID=A0A3A8E6I8_9GAMM|nr:replication initiation protein [Acinetobacter rongchengensis]RKG30682.1 RepB family plasmid replication initiator protein [Acinetobacter rongchengensis]
MKNDLVVMDNNLIRASYKLTANEMRLVLCALAQIPKDAEVDPGKAYYITKEDFVKLGVEPKNVAREIREACSELLNRIVVVDTAMGKLKFHWLHSVLHFKSEIFERLKKEYPNSKNDEEFIQQLRKYNLLDSLPIIAKSDDNIVARIVFHENMIPYISQLKEQFTKLNLKDVFQFSSFYSFRFYLMMMQFKETGFCKISIAELRDSLDLNNKYQLFADLKKWVIDTAIDEINEKSPHTVGYELIKKGRTYTHLELRFKEKKAEIKTVKCPNTIDMFEEPKDTFIKMSDSQLDTFASKLADLGEVQAMANVGEEMPSFKARLRSILKDPEKQKILIPYLKKLGFKP